MKKNIKKFLSLIVVMSILFTGCVQSSAPETDSQAEDNTTQSNEEIVTNDDAVTLTIWDWDEDFMTYMTNSYMAQNPNVKFNTLVVSVSDYMQKLQSALASGGDVPDIILSQMAKKGSMFELGVYDDLRQEPYNYEPENQFGYSATLSTGPNGELFGVDQMICPAGFAYRRDLAQEYLGTDDPDEIGEMISDYDKFYDVAKTIQEKSNGEVYAFPGIDTFVTQVLVPQFAAPYIDGDNIDITSRYTPVFDIATRFNQAGLIGNMLGDTPALYNGFADGDFVFFPVTTWSMKWEIAQNDPEGSGRWGATTAPQNGFTYGGTTVGVYKNSEHKEEAWDYLKYAYIDGPGVQESYDQFGFMTGDVSMYDDDSFYFTEEGKYDEFFGGQNMADFFVHDVSVDTVGQIQTKAESSVISALGNVTAEMSANPQMTTQECIDKLIKETQLLLPSANIY